MKNRQKADYCFDAAGVLTYDNVWPELIDCGNYK